MLISKLFLRLQLLLQLELFLSQFPYQFLIVFRDLINRVGGEIASFHGFLLDFAAF